MNSSFTDIPIGDIIYFLNYYNVNIPLGENNIYLTAWNYLLEINNSNKPVPQSIARWIQLYNKSRGYTPDLILPSNLIWNILNFSDTDTILSFCSTNNDYYNFCKEANIR